MSVVLTINGTGYDYPETDDQLWGPDATAWAQAVTTGMLQKAGGLFLLLAEVDFGTGYGLKSLYYKSRATNPASTGILRLGNAEEIVWRNAANDDEFSLTVNSSDILVFDGQGISIGGDPVQTAITVAGNSQILPALSVGNELTATLVAGGITNTEINAAAAIAFSKLATLTSGNLLVGSAGNVPTSVAMSGDATIIASGALTIANNAVSNAKLAQMATLTIKGNNTGGTANALDLTAAEVTAMLIDFVGDSGSGGTKGLVPAPASGDAAADKFLKADGTWVAPAGAGDVVGPASATDEGIALFDGTTGKLLKNSAAILPLAKGGTNAALTAAAGGIPYSTASAFALTAAGTANQYLKSNGASAPTWQTFTPPTVQKFTSGSDAYTTPANVKYIRVRMVGGGGGGGGSGNTAGAGGSGGTTTFGTTLLSAGGGGGGQPFINGSGSTSVSLGTGPYGTALEGADGQGAASSSVTTSYAAITGGQGAATPFGGGGAGGIGSGSSGGAGLSAKANTGAGGGGAGSNTASTNSISGAGGGAGAFIDAIIPSPTTSYAYAVGEAGTAGTAGTGGSAGGAGGSGYIEVTEFYS